MSKSDYCQHVSFARNQVLIILEENIFFMQTDILEANYS